MCVQHGYKKKQCRNNGCTNNAIRNGVCINHGAKRYCTIPECGKPLSGREVQISLQMLVMASTIDSLADDITVAANAIVGMHHEASSTTSGSVLGGHKFHFAR
jgi:hypothetical protein